MNQESTTELRKRICASGRKAVVELIKIAEAEIIMDGAKWGKNDEGDLVIQGLESGDEIPPDRLTRAAQAKKIAIMDALEILNQIDTEEKNMKSIEEGPSTAILTPEKRAQSKRA